MSKATFCLLIPIAMLFSMSAFPVDGVVLLNQASVMAAGGFPYQINSPGSYKLSSNLTITGATDAIDINTDDVVLDLNGFSIVGPVTCTGIPVTSCTGTAGIAVQIKGNDITVRNGTVKGMLTGVVSNGEGTLIEDLHLSQNSNVGLAISSGIVRHSHVLSNGTGGIAISGGVVEGNVIEFNQFTGIEIGHSSNNADGVTVIGNSVIRNGGYGMIAQHAVYGSNIFRANGFGSVGISPGIEVTSQNNNNCNGNAC